MSFLFNCRESVHATSDSVERPLGFLARMNLWLHKVLCPPCRRYSDQIMTIRKAARASHDIVPEQQTLPDLTAEQKSKLKQAVEQAAKGF